MLQHCSLWCATTYCVISTPHVSSTVTALPGLSTGSTGKSPSCRRSSVAVQISSAFRSDKHKYSFACTFIYTKCLLDSRKKIVLFWEICYYIFSPVLKSLEIWWRMQMLSLLWFCGRKWRRSSTTTFSWWSSRSMDTRVFSAPSLVPGPCRSLIANTWTVVQSSTRPTSEWFENSGHYVRLFK